MTRLILNQEELSELEVLQVRGGGGPGGLEPPTQYWCSNTVTGCGGGAPQFACTNSAEGCGHWDPKPHPSDPVPTE